MPVVFGPQWFRLFAVHHNDFFCRLLKVSVEGLRCLDSILQNSSETKWKAVVGPGA